MTVQHRPMLESSWTHLLSNTLPSDINIVFVPNAFNLEMNVKNLLLKLEVWASGPGLSNKTSGRVYTVCLRSLCHMTVILV